MDIFRSDRLAAYRGVPREVLALTVSWGAAIHRSTSTPVSIREHSSPAVSPASAMTSWVNAVTEGVTSWHSGESSQASTARSAGTRMPSPISAD